MAILVPDDLSNLPQEPTEGEKALIIALCKILDDEWTVYVQPYLNGLKPDIIIFCEDAGLGIFEVKDWDLDVHKIKGNKENGYKWLVRSKDTGEWVKPKHGCPLKQVDKYRQSIFKYEIPILGSKKLLDDHVFSLVQPYVYFHKHTTDDVEERLEPILDAYSNVFGYDYVEEPEYLEDILNERYLCHGSKFTELMKETELAGRLANALAFPKHGMTNIEHLLNLTKKQQILLDRIEERASLRVKGAAGCGKTLLLAHKAAMAATEGKNVLVVCFNITMVNYIQDLVKRLARYYGEKDGNPHSYRNIEVGHFHRFFPLEEKTQTCRRNSKEPVDILLIDEGQDFERTWVDKLLTEVCRDDCEFMFCEDRQQNIYERQEIKRQAMPIQGRPSGLNDSYRIPEKTAQLANFLSTCAELEGLKIIKSIKPLQGNLFVRNLWFNGTYRNATKALAKDIKALTTGKNNARPDIAILVCTVEDGWKVCEVLESLHLPSQCSFEPKEENEILKRKKDEDKLRRGYKVGFWMQTGKIKVATIHSFKGWELSNILVFFNPAKRQKETFIELLYTAITRSQECLTIYNMDSDLYEFGDLAIEEGYVEAHPMHSE
ncbi:MAG: AAA family ATPase [Cyanobacteriota bacterium]|nr:AAA family ATPase [Cyanobacteriota bacterium]